MYAVLFARHGASTAAISGLFVLWSATSMVLQVPAGALADRVSRRGLLAVAALMRAGGFALWVALPSLPSFAAGFVLWGASSALESGTFEALVYDELAGAGAASAYGRLAGRLGSISWLATAGAALLTIPMLHAGGLPLVGWTSVGLSAVCAAVAYSLPRRARVETADGAGGVVGYVATLRAGVVQARRSPPVRGALLVASTLPVVLAADEYVPLLASQYLHRSDLTLVPVFLLVVTATAAAGSWASGRWWDARAGRVALVLAISAVLLLVGAGSGTLVGFIGLAVAYGAAEYGMVTGQVRVQHAVEGPARATVTSVAEVGSELAAALMFASFGLLARWLPITLLVAVLAGPLALIAVMTRRWLGPTDRVPPTGRLP